MKSRFSAHNASADSTAGTMPYLWFLSSALLVFLLDQVGRHGTVPFGQIHPLLDLGLGAAVAVLWLRGWKWWPSVALAGLVSGMLLGHTWIGVPLYAAGLVLSAGLARGLLTICGFDTRMRNVTDVLALALLAAPVAALVAGVLEAALPSFALNGDARMAWKCLVAEFAAGWSGIILLTPFLLSLSAEYFQRWNPARMWEWLTVNLLLVASLLMMMIYLTGGEQHWFPLAYLGLPFIFWAAWRFGPSGAALANVFVGGVTAMCAWHQLGPFGVGGGLLVMMLAWAFLGFHGLIALLLAAVTDERRIELMQQRQRARFLRQVLEQLPCGVLVKDITDKPVLVNRRWFQLLGRPVGTEEDQLQHQKSVDPFWRARELTLLQNLGEVLREEAEGTDYDGRPVELLFTKQAAYFDERGERLLMVLADDISGGRASLVELRKTLTRVRDTLAVAEVGLWEWHIPTGIIRFDAQFGKLAGIAERPEGLSVQAWQDSIYYEDRAEFQTAMLSHLHHQAALFAARFRYRRGAEWVWLIVRGRVVEQDVRKLGVRMLGTLQEARATVTPLPDPNASVSS
ncbi:MAG: MASE1 domain-containing protein [Opitutales bacterium]|jgi:PAS domain-containing protein